MANDSYFRARISRFQGLTGAFGATKVRTLHHGIILLPFFRGDQVHGDQKPPPRTGASASKGAGLWGPRRQGVYCFSASVFSRGKEGLRLQQLRILSVTDWILGLGHL